MIFCYTYDQCLVKSLTEKLVPTTDAEIHSQTCRAWETGDLEKSALNGTSPSVTFPQNSTNPAEEEAERIQESESAEDDKEARSSKSTYIKLTGAHKDWSRVYRVYIELHQVFCIEIMSSNFNGISDCRNTESPTLRLFNCCWFVFSNYDDVIVFVLPYCILFCYIFFKNEWMNDWISTKVLT